MQRNNFFEKIKKKSFKENSMKYFFYIRNIKKEKCWIHQKFQKKIYF